jgi:hypothetical protein
VGRTLRLCAQCENQNETQYETPPSNLGSMYGVLRAPYTRYLSHGLFPASMKMCGLGCSHLDSIKQIGEGGRISRHRRPEEELTDSLCFVDCKFVFIIKCRESGKFVYLLTDATHSFSATGSAGYHAPKRTRLPFRINYLLKLIVWQLGCSCLRQQGQIERGTEDSTYNLYLHLPQPS